MSDCFGLRDRCMHAITIELPVSSVGPHNLTSFALQVIEHPQRNPGRTFWKVTMSGRHSHADADKIECPLSLLSQSPN
jgi:hypothetical protein